MFCKVEVERVSTLWGGFGMMLKTRLEVVLSLGYNENLRNWCSHDGLPYCMLRW